MVSVLSVLIFAAVVDPLAQGRNLYLEAVEGSTDALGRAAAFFRSQPAQPVVLAYRGGLQLLESRRAFAPWNKGKLARAGMELLTQAVNSAPDNLEVRFLRASAAYNLPSFLGQSAIAEADLARLAPVAVNAALEGKLDPRMAAAALLYHGEIRLRRNDKTGAGQAWRDAVRAGPNTRAGTAANQKLRIL